MLKGNYKAIGVAVLAAVILFALLSRCTGGGGGKESKFLNQIQGYWTIESLIQSDGSTSLFRPREISITKNAIQLGSKTTPCPMSEAEYKDGALYFTAQWYESFSFNGQEPGIQSKEQMPSRLAMCLLDEMTSALDQENFSFPSPEGTLHRHIPHQIPIYPPRYQSFQREPKRLSF